MIPSPPVTTVSLQVPVMVAFSSRKSGDDGRPGSAQSAIVAGISAQACCRTLFLLSESDARSGPSPMASPTKSTLHQLRSPSAGVDAEIVQMLPGRKKRRLCLGRSQRRMAAGDAAHHPQPLSPLTCLFGCVSNLRCSLTTYVSPSSAACPLHTILARHGLLPPLASQLVDSTTYRVA